MGGFSVELLNRSSNPEFSMSLWTFITKHRSSDTIVSDIYSAYTREIEYIFDIILFNIYSYELTAYYYRIASMSRINGMNQSNTFKELVDYTYKIIEYHGYDSVHSDAYIAYDKAMHKYLSFDNPKSDISLFLIRNIMLNFRDYIRNQTVLFRHVDREVEMPNLAIEDEYFMDKDNLIDINNLSFGGYEVKVNRLAKYILYLKYIYKADNINIGRKINMETKDISSLLKWRTYEKKG